MCVAALGLIGGIVSGVGAFMGAQQQAAAYDYQGKLHDRQAVMEREAGSYQAARKLEEGRQVIGGQIAAYGANGLSPDADVVASSARAVDMDVAAIRYGAIVRADNEKAQAGLARMNASNARASAPFAFLSPVIKGFSTTLGNSNFGYA